MYIKVTWGRKEFRYTEFWQGSVLESTPLKRHGGDRKNGSSENASYEAVNKLGTL
jgi:hypothetical protein